MYPADNVVAEFDYSLHGKVGVFCPCEDITVIEIVLKKFIYDKYSWFQWKKPLATSGTLRIGSWNKYNTNINCTDNKYLYCTCITA